MRFWARLFRRASIPIEYTQGFTPHPRMAVAAPLAVGVTGDAELMDIWLRKWLPPQSAVMMARRQLPDGFVLLDAWEVPVGAPGLQATVRTARYVCVASHAGGVVAAQGAVDAFLRAESVVYSFKRGEEERSVDLRPLVHSVAVRQEVDDLCRVEVEVAIGQEGSARPDHILGALGFSAPAVSIHRVGLYFESPNLESGPTVSHRG